MIRGRRSKNRTGGPAFDLARAANELGAPLFAFFAKGGYDAGRSAGFDSTEISLPNRYHARPCKERKSGAPTTRKRERNNTERWAARPSTIDADRAGRGNRRFASPQY